LRAGDAVRVTCAPKLAYGDAGLPGSVPQGSFLIYDVVLLQVAAPAAYAGPAASSAAESGLLFGQDPHKIMYYVSAVVGAIGIGLAAFFHGPKGLTGLVIGGRTSSDKTRMDGLSRAIRPVSTWAERKWLVDELYQFLIVGPLWLVSNVFAAIDRFIVDGIVDGLGRLPRALGEIIRPAQNGVLHGYALRMLGGLAVVLLIVVVFAL
ncbi:MAG: FKBP-type peptidyl-prolyl cis-trans isomerase, partial [Planctomycetota bacterium]